MLYNTGGLRAVQHGGLHAVQNGDYMLYNTGVTCYATRVLHVEEHGKLHAVQHGGYMLCNTGGLHAVQHGGYMLYNTETESSLPCCKHVSVEHTNRTKHDCASVTFIYLCT